MLMNDVDTVEFIKDKFLEIRAKSNSKHCEKFERNLEITIEYFTLMDDNRYTPGGVYWDAKAINQIAQEHDLSYTRVTQTICSVLCKLRYITQKHGITE
jgi:hypothetical protein